MTSNMRPRKSMMIRDAAYKKALDEINNLNRDNVENPALSPRAKSEKAKERDNKIANIKSMEREIKEFRQTREHQLQEQLMRMREGIVNEITYKIRTLGGDVENIIFDKSGIVEYQRRARADVFA